MTYKRHLALRGTISLVIIRLLVLGTVLLVEKPSQSHLQIQKVFFVYSRQVLSCLLGTQIESKIPAYLSLGEMQSCLGQEVVPMV